MKFIYCFFLVLFSILLSFGFQQKKPSESIVNFEYLAIDDHAEILLDSDWEFYWNKLLKPGEFEQISPLGIVSLNNWTEFDFPNTEKLPSFGYATYRLKVTLHTERPPTSLYIPKIYSSSKIWINGKFISETGRVGKTKEQVLHRRFSQIVPLDTNKTNFEIVIQVSNFYHQNGGISKSLKVSSSKHLYNLNSKQIIADMIFIGCLGFIGVFFLFFYLFYWNKDQAVLCFAIFCFALSYMALSDRYAPVTEILKTVNWIILTRIEYIMLFLAGTAGSLFFKEIFTFFVHKLYSKIMIYNFYIFLILVLLLPSQHFTKLLLPFIVIMLINLIYVMLIIFKAIISKQQARESKLLLISMLIGSILFFIHIFFFLEQNEYAIIYINFGYVVGFLLLSMLLMTRFSNSFKELELAKNVALQQRQEISVNSIELTNLNKKLEDNLKLLENYNTELDDFNHIVSHDLKSPLVSIYSLVSFIEEDFKDNLQNKTKNHLKLLKGVVSKMDALINGLLEYSKVAKGNKKKELFSFNALLKQVITIVDYQNKSTINLPNDDIEIYANKVELNHVFQNLISNSIKHNDKENTIIDISVAEISNEYIFTVGDNGPGIEPQHHDKIFKIFNQLKVNDDVNSTGIGLAIVKKVITENKGLISIESEKGVGLKIKFSWQI